MACLKCKSQAQKHGNIDNSKRSHCQVKLMMEEDVKTFLRMVGCHNLVLWAFPGMSGMKGRFLLQYLPAVCGQ